MFHPAPLGPRNRARGPAPLAPRPSTTLQPRAHVLRPPPAPAPATPRPVASDRWGSVQARRRRAPGPPTSAQGPAPSPRSPTPPPTCTTIQPPAHRRTSSHHPRPGPAGHRAPGPPASTQSPTHLHHHPAACERPPTTPVLGFHRPTSSDQRPVGLDPEECARQASAARACAPRRRAAAPGRPRRARGLWREPCARGPRSSSSCRAHTESRTWTIPITAKIQGFLHVKKKVVDFLKKCILLASCIPSPYV